VTPTPAEEAKRLNAVLSNVAGALYAVDSGADMVFVRSLADAGNRPAADLVGSLGLAWERYPLAKDAVDRLDTALAARDHAAVNALLGPAAVTLPDGASIAVVSLLEDVQLRVEHLGTDVTRIAGAARVAVTRLDAARIAYHDILVRAGAVGANDDVEVTSVRTAIERATAAVVADPATVTDLDDLDRLLGAARDRVELLERSHRELPGHVAVAIAQLDEIESLALRGAQVLARTREKIDAPAGVLPPVDLSADGDRALRPWLDRIRAQAASGSAEAAAAILAAWQKAADARLADARRVADANAAPLVRRNELRGLIDAYRAKAAGSGRDEDGRLDRLYAAAKQALYAAPCALDAAEVMVRDYVGAVNAVVAGAR